MWISRVKVTIESMHVNESNCHAVSLQLASLCDCVLTSHNNCSVDRMHHWVVISWNACIVITRYRRDMITVKQDKMRPKNAPDTYMVKLTDLPQHGIHSPANVWKFKEHTHCKFRKNRWCIRWRDDLDALFLINKTHRNEQTNIFPVSLSVDVVALRNENKLRFPTASKCCD